MLRSRRWILAALAVGVGLALLARTAMPPAAAPHKATAPAAKPPVVPAPLTAAVARLRTALVAGDVGRLCRPNAIFTAAVVQEMGSENATCEATVEDMLTYNRVPPLGVAGASVKPDLATAQVRANGGQTVPLTLVRSGRRWLVSFSDGTDPLSALMV